MIHLDENSDKGVEQAAKEHGTAEGCVATPPTCFIEVPKEFHGPEGEKRAFERVAEGEETSGK